MPLHTFIGLVAAAVAVNTLPCQEGEEGSSHPSPQRKAINQLRQHASNAVALRGRVEYTTGTVCEDYKDVIGVTQWQLQLEHLQSEYVGRLVEWERSDVVRSFRVYEKGKLVRDAFFDGAQLFEYFPSSQSARRRSGFSCVVDLSPDIYFLDLDNRPFGRMISSDAPIHQLEGGMLEVCAPDPGVATGQFRIVFTLAPLLIHRISYTPAPHPLVAEFRFLDHEIAPGAMELRFPRRIEQSFFLNGKHYTEKALTISELSVLSEHRTQFRVPTGTRVKDYVEGNPTIYLAGPLTDEQLSAHLREALSWHLMQATPSVFGKICAPADLAERREDGGDECSISERANNCGPYCLAQALLLCEKPVSIGPLLSAMHPQTPMGHKLRDLQEAAEQMGATTLACNLEKWQIIQASVPAIIPVKRHDRQLEADHYVLVAGASSDRLLIVDAGFDALEADDKWLAEHWDGAALLISCKKIELPRNYTWTWTLGALAVCVLVIRAIVVAKKS